jgi:hypothetical protein
MNQLELGIAPFAPPPAALPPPPPYIVSLRECELAAPARIKIEARFCKTLEARLGEPNQVAAMLAQLQDAEFQERPLTPDEKDMGARWQLAYAAARQAALQDLDAITGAWFDVRVT